MGSHPRMRRLLIVDDDPAIGRLLEDVARELGWDPVLAHDGAEALDRYAELLPEAVITDVVLPRIDGLEVCRRIKATATGAFTPVLVVSGVYRDGQEARRHFRADDFLPKPLSLDPLRRRLSTLFPPPIEAGAAPQPEPDEKAIGGEPLAMAVAALRRARRTGTLHVRGPGAQVTLRWNDGQLVGCEGAPFEEPLAALLERLHRVPPEMRARLERKGGPERLAELVVAEGILTSDELQGVVAARRAQRLCEVLAWTEGAWRFVDGPVPASKPIELAGALHRTLRQAPVALQDVTRLVPGPAALVRDASVDPVLGTLALSRAEKWMLERATVRGSFDELLAQVSPADALARQAMCSAARVFVAIGAVRTEPVPVAPRVSAEPASGRPMQGSLCALLLALWRARATGMLQIAPPAGPLALYLRAGRVVAARENPTESPSAWLARRGLSSGDSPEAAEVARVEVRRALVSLTRVRDGQATFFAGLQQDGLPRHEWDTSVAVVECLRAQETAYLAAIGPAAHQAVERAPRADEWASLLALSPLESQVLEAARTAARPMGLARATGLPVDDVVRAVGVLLSLGLARLVSAAPDLMTPPVLEAEPDPLAGIDPDDLDHLLQSAPDLVTPPVATSPPPVAPQTRIGALEAQVGELEAQLLSVLAERDALLGRVEALQAELAALRIVPAADAAPSAKRASAVLGFALLPDEPEPDVPPVDEGEGAVIVIKRRRS